MKETLKRIDPEQINRTQNQQPVKLGDIVYTNDPEKYNLLGIGTCIAVYIYNLKNHQYMMAHTVLPEYDDQFRKFDSEMPGKYTDLAIRLIVKRFLKENSHKEDLKAKIVGGSQIFNDQMNIGKKNAQIAKKILKEESISLISEDIGGDKGRSIYSFNKNGTIIIKKNGAYFEI